MICNHLQWASPIAGIYRPFRAKYGITTLTKRHWNTIRNLELITDGFAVVGKIQYFAALTVELKEWRLVSSGSGERGG